MFATEVQLINTELFRFYDSKNTAIEYIANLLMGDPNISRNPYFHWIKIPEKCRYVANTTSEVYELKYRDSKPTFLEARIFYGKDYDTAKISFPVNPVTGEFPVIEMRKEEGKITECLYYSNEAETILPTEQAFKEIEKFEYFLHGATYMIAAYDL